MIRYLASQQGFSLVKILVILAVFAGALLYFLPDNIVGGPLEIVNQISAKVKSIVNGLGSTLKQLINKVKSSIDIVGFRFSEQIANLLDRLNMKGLAKQLKEVKAAWETDMNTLIDVSKSRGFEMSQIQQSYDEYVDGSKSWRRVEVQYWNEIRKQTQAAIEKSFKNFLSRPVGCSDFTVELKKIWEIGEEFNKDTYEGYVRAKELSAELNDPRSPDFLPLVLEWMNIAGLYRPLSNDDWFMQQLRLAIDLNTGKTIYPQIIQQIDAQASSNPMLCIVANVVIAEIYLNHDLLNGSMERYDDAIRALYGIARQIDQTSPYSYQALGIHMTLGLLNERLCSNADLALKEFKDAIAIARRLNIPCYQYGTAHYHLAIMNLRIRDRATIQPKFVASTTSNMATVNQLLATEPANAPQAMTPTPAPSTQVSSESGVVKGTIPPGGGRALVEVVTTPISNPTPGREERPSEITGVVVTPVATPTPIPTVVIPTYTSDVVKGTLSPEDVRRVERDIRLRPRPELGETVKMQQFTIDQLYDLSRIPEDAVREFETYLKCENQGEEVIVARYVLEKYLGK